MYYEEKIINGILMYRSNPDDAFIPKPGVRAEAVNALSYLSPKERVAAMKHFCSKCGEVSRNGDHGGIGCNYTFATNFEFKQTDPSDPRLGGGRPVSVSDEPSMDEKERIRREFRRRMQDR